jgi:hypothetical protein
MDIISIRYNSFKPNDKKGMKLHLSLYFKLNKKSMITKVKLYIGKTFRGKRIKKA